MDTPEINTVPFRNASDQPCNLAAIGGPIVAPGEIVHLPIGVIAPSRKDNGGRKKSTIEQVAPQMRPADPAFEREWIKVPEPAAAISRIVTVTPRAPAAPAGVQAMREAAKRAAKPAAPAAKPAAPATKVGG